MELIELDATAQRAMELLTNAGMSDGSIYDYTHTGFGSMAFPCMLYIMEGVQEILAERYLDNLFGGDTTEP